MKLAKMMGSLSNLTGRTGLMIKNYSPEILLVVGIAGGVTATVLACRATLKVEAVLDEHNEAKEKINLAWQKVEDGELSLDEYSEQDKKRDLAIVYGKTGWNFVKLYGPSVTLGVVSIGCILGGHRIMKSRNVAIMAAYKVLEEGFTSYRKRVIEDLGEERDYMYKNNLRSEVVTEEVADENGKVKKVKTNKLTPIDPNKHSIYARFFDESCGQWVKDPEYNLMFLKVQQSYFNDILQAKGHVFLNEVYDALGMKRSKAGAVVGWVLSPDGDNYIDFGIYDASREKVRDFVNGFERSILLDFNVDGVIYDLFTKETD